MENRFFTDSHEWIEVDNGIATIGISDFAQAELGDITYIDLPNVGDNITKGKDFAAIESVKAASDVYAPVSGEIIEVNSNLDTTPELLNSAPYTDGWLIKVKLNEEPTGLLSESEYNEKYIH